MMNAEFAKLAAYAREHDIRVTIAMVPDIHSLTNYPFGLFTRSLHRPAHDNGFAYIDLLPAFKGLAPEEI